MHSGEMFRKLNNFTNVPLVCDDGSVILAHKVHFFINILFYFQSLVHRDKQEKTKKMDNLSSGGNFVAGRRPGGLSR